MVNLVKSVMEKTWEMDRCFDVCFLFKYVTIEKKSYKEEVVKASFKHIKKAWKPWPKVVHIIERCK